MKDRRGRSQRPRRLGEALDRALAPIAPKTPLAEIQRLWAGAVGDRIAEVTKVVEEREGTVTIECSNSIWAAELDMMAPQLLERLGSVMKGQAPEKLRFRTGL